jgi:hypothetical protein
VLKRGGTMKQAASSWRGGHRRNPWKDDPVGHSVAAIRGWRKRGKRAKSRPKAWRTGQYRKAHVRRSSRLTRRYARRGTVRVAANPRRRSYRRRSYRRTRRNILTNILTNPRRRRSYRRNPGLATFKDSFKQMLTMETLVEGATITGGMLAAVALPNLILGLGPLKNIAALNLLRRGWGSYAASLLAAGLASAAAAYFGKQKIARQLLIGGVAGTITRIVYDVVVPKAPGAVAAALKAPGAGLLGLGSDEVEQAVEAAVNAELARQGISDYLVPGEAFRPGVGDYLTGGDVATTLSGEGEDEMDPVFMASEQGYM